MRIGVNVRLLIKNRIDGIARFSYESLKRITVQHPEHQFIFFFDRSYPQEFIFNGNIIPVIVPPQTRRPILNNIWTDYTLPLAMRFHKVDLFLSTDGLLPLSVDVPCLPVIHDLNFEHHPDWLPGFALRYYQNRYPLFAAKAARIATVSTYSKNDIHERYHIPLNKIDVVYNGVSGKFKPLDAVQSGLVRDQFAAGQPYILCVGSVHPRKNLVNTLLAFDDYCSRTMSPKHMIVAGEKYFGNDKMEQVLAGMKHRELVHFTGKVDDDTLIKLYGAAHTFVYASLFEGFGIPVLEAMQSHVPVIASNTTSLPEVCGDAAILVNPDQWQQISDAMIEADHDNLRNKLINLGQQRVERFTWDNTANLLWNSIEQTIEQENI